MSWLEDIKKQPRRTREIMFALSVITVISLVGVLWLRSFQRNVYALMNPADSYDQKFFAQGGNSIFTKGWDGLRAAISSVLSLSPQPQPVDQANGSVYTLPLSGDKQ